MFHNHVLLQMWSVLIRDYSSSEYITNANPDDRRTHDSLERQIEFLNEHPEYAMVSGAVRACTLGVGETDTVNWIADERCSTWFGENEYVCAFVGFLEFSAFVFNFLLIADMNFE